MSRLRLFLSFALLLAGAHAAWSQKTPYTYIRAGEAANVPVQPLPVVERVIDGQRGHPHLARGAVHLQGQQSPMTHDHTRPVAHRCGQVGRNGVMGREREVGLARSLR